MDHHSHRKTQHNHHQVQCHHLQWRGQHNHPHHCQRCKDCHLYHTPQSIMYHSHRQHKHLPEDCEIALEWCSLNQGRVVVGTKDWNHDNQGAGDTYQTQVGYTITNKVKRSRHHFRQRSWIVQGACTSCILPHSSYKPWQTLHDPHRSCQRFRRACLESHPT